MEHFRLIRVCLSKHQELSLPINKVRGLLALFCEKEYLLALDLINNLKKYDLWIGSQYITMHLIFNTDTEFFFEFGITGDSFTILNDTINRFHNSPKNFSQEETDTFLFEYNIRTNDFKTFIRKIKKNLGYQIQPL